MRKLGLISSLWAALLYFPLTGFALGLGEIEISSFLNQPLKAEIEVISARPGEVDDLLISLASRDAFAKAGLERPADLSKLRFQVEKSEDGQSAKILVTTKVPVKEPFLSFLVEADWAKGRLLREFTVLLDPPSFAQQAVEAKPQVAPEQPETTQPSAALQQPIAQETSAFAESEPVEDDQAVSQPIALTEEPAYANQAPYSAEKTMRDVADSGQIVVAKGDTLWGIAAQYKDQRHSMAQVMLAMQMMTPQAFGKNNINNLKVGSVLRVPDRDALDRLNKQEAYAQVLEQNGLWDEYLARSSRSTSAGSPVAAAGSKGSQQKAKGQLSLLTPGEGDSDSASLQDDANSANAGKIRKQLALAEEELEAARLENKDLSSRIESLEQQLKKFEDLQKLVQIEDSSLALMQDSASKASITEPSAETAGDVMTGMVEEQPAEQKPSDMMIEAADAILAQDSLAQVPEQLPGVKDELAQSTEAETVMDTATEASDAALPAPIIVTDVSDADTDGVLPSLDNLLTDPIMLGGLGVIFALLLGFILLKRKKASEDEAGITLEEPDNLSDEDETPIHVPSVSEEVADETAALNLGETEEMGAGEYMAETLASQVEDEDEDEFSRTAIISSDEQPETEAAAQPEDQDDVLNEVDVYLAYGLYDNAEDLLNDSLLNSPDRADYRAKLLDTYFATKNKAAFVREAEILKSLGGAADRFWDRIQTMGFELAPENDLFSGARDSHVSVEDLGYVKPEVADFDIGVDEDGTDFSNTDFDLSNDSFDISSTLSLDAVEDDLSSTQLLNEPDIDFPDLDEEDNKPDADVLMTEDELPDDIGFGEEEPVLADELGEDIDIDDINIIEDINDSDVIEDNEDFGVMEELEVENEQEIELEDANEDRLSFNLPDDMDASLEDDAFDEIIELDPTVEAPPSNELPVIDDEDVDGVNLDLADAGNNELDTLDVDADDLTNETLVMSPADLAAKTEKAATDLDDELDFDMSDMEDADLQTGEFIPSDIDRYEEEITEFKPADATGEFDAFDMEDSAEDAVEEVDSEAGLDKTGTFAPGDFSEEDAVDSITSADEYDDIEDLMLPDDVDEVGTKLDLAKAFIDMGDAEGARSSLEEVLTEGTDEQKAEATDLLNQIS